MSADVSLNFRVGPAKSSTSAADPRFVAAKAVELLRQAAEAKGADRVVEAIVANQNQIVADVAADASKFAASAARIFTRIKSPPTGRISISLDDITRGAGVSSTDSMSKRLKGKSTVEWVALTQKTIANKRRRARRRGSRSTGDVTTFFVDSGDLRQLLLTYLGPAVALLLDPKISVRRGPRKVTATISVMAQASGREKAGVTGASFPGAASPGAVAREESLFVRYLKRAGARDDPRHPLAYKLENPAGQHRPFLQNTLVFWLSTRLPVVLEKSLRMALAKRTRKGK
ncbi:hypothetical protein [Methylorubrum suomiense]|uniref:Uncharacterized protein n=1 Tax=Methylorubrum suomiense TaxID=144191 RepID=A0ABQ4V3E5_9HYPH|nr:hypothetical protein [Methylorubrum suomiense]GJE78084.1 hypothetical protein BGCPKDLD_4695 [Methylorubrum suomiense]